MRRAGSRHNVASEHKWAEWQAPPVLCALCGVRVTLKQPFFGSFLHGTFHRECAPYTVSLQVSNVKKT